MNGTAPHHQERNVFRDHLTKIRLFTIFLSMQVGGALAVIRGCVPQDVFTAALKLPFRVHDHARL